MRRTHLYLGLVLLPWVALYGATALLFNHAGWMSTARESRVGADELAGTALADAAPPAERAREAFARLAARARSAGAELELVEGSERWLGSWVLRERTAEGDTLVWLDPGASGGKVRHTPAREESARPAWAEEAALAGWRPVTDAERDALLALGGAVAAARGPAPAELEVRRTPELRFHVREGAHELVCDVRADGGLDVRPVQELSTLRHRLLRLHKQHGEPGHDPGLRLWALLVDAMGAAMLLWGASGVVMWWSLRPTRRAGLVALGAGSAGLALLAALVWRAAGIA